MLSESQFTRNVKIFISYSPKDVRLKNELLKHLSSLKRKGSIESWDVQQIRAGDKRDEETLKHLDEANVILCLLSADFLHSDYCYTVEMGRALERQKSGEVEVIPVLLRAVDWQETPLHALQAIPRDHKPIADRSNKDKVLAGVAREIARVVDELMVKNV